MYQLKTARTYAVFASTRDTPFLERDDVRDTQELERDDAVQGASVLACS